MPLWKNKRLWQAIAAVVVLVALLFGANFLPIRPWLLSFVDWVQSHGVAGVALFMTVYVVATVCLFPAAWFTAASALAFGFWWGLLVAGTSASIGAALSFLIARYLARGAVERWVSKSKKARAMDGVIGPRDWKIVLLVRLTPVVPFVFSNYFFGLTRLRFSTYVVASTVGIFPGAIVYAYLGYLGKVALSGAKNHRGPSEYLFLSLGLAVTVVLVLYVSRKAKKAIESASAAEIKVGDVEPSARK